MELDAGSDRANALTRRQQLVWLEQQLNPDLPSSNMVMTFAIEGPLDPERLRRAFASVAADADALRTVVQERDGAPRQRVLAAPPRELEIVDLSREPDPRAAAERWLDACATRRFDLAQAAYDTAVLRLGEASWLWVLCQHHLITDGRSFELLYEQVARRYADPSAPPLDAAPYAAYVEWERAYRESEQAREDAAFWREKLASPPERAHFYGSRPRVQGPGVVRRVLELASRTRAALESYGKDHFPGGPSSDLAATALFAAALAAWVHRVSGNRRVGIGLPVLNRRTRGVRRTLGLFMEVQVLSLEVDPDESFQGLVDRSWHALVETLRHGRHCHDNPAHAKSYDVMLNLHRARFAPFCGWPTHAESTTGVARLARDASRAESYWRAGDDLVLQVQDFDGSGVLRLDFDCNADVFANGLADATPRHFERLLESALIDPTRAIGTLALLDAGERRRVLDEPNPVPDAIPFATALDAIDARIAHAPERVAVRAGDRAQGYGELGRASRAIASALRRHGVAAGDRVGVLLDRGPDLVAALLGIWRAGAAYVPLDPDHPPERLRWILEDACPRLVLCARALAARMPGGAAPAIAVEDLDGDDAAELAPPGPDACAYVLFTSGSTGRPKGVAVTHGALANLLASMAREPGLGPDDRLLAVTTISFDIAALELWGPLTTGGEVLLVPRAVATDATRLRDAIETLAPTLMQATPATWRMLVAAGWSGSPSLRVLCGGEALSRALADELLARADEVWNLYGPTETTIWSALDRVRAGSEPPAIGHPIANTRIYVLDAAREPVPFGVPGEIWIGGAGVASGYLGRPDLTTERFVADPFGPPGARMYRTGDLGRHRADGRLECLGRADRQVKLRGFRVELAEIEHAIAATGAVAACAAGVRPGADGEARLLAWLTPDGDAPIDEPALRAQLRARLPAHMVPAELVVLAALPLTPNGKIDHAALPAPESVPREPSRSFVPPRSELERTVAQAWEAALERRPVGIHDDFFDLGGNSIAALGVFRRLRRALGIELPLATLFRAPTVERMAAAIAARGAGASSDWTTLVEIQGGGDLPPLYCAAGMGGNITNLRRLARHLGPRQPFYGLQTRGVAGHAVAPHTRVEEIARESLEDLRRVQPHGPYYLAGYSAGGAVAFEMAQRLTREGESVRALLFLDAYAPSIPTRTRGERLAIHLERLRRQGPGYLLRKLRDRAVGDALRLRDRAFRLRARLLPSRYAHERFVHQRWAIQQSYVPEPWSGRGTLFRVGGERVADDTRRADDGSNGWRALFPNGLDVIAAPGDHLHMCEEPHVRELASLVAEALAAARVRA